MIVEEKEVKVEGNEFQKKELVRAKDTLGMFEVVTAIPTSKPTRFLDQIKIYKNGSDYTFYAYDYVNDHWADFTITIITTP